MSIHTIAQHSTAQHSTAAYQPVTGPADNDRESDPDKTHGELLNCAKLDRQWGYHVRTANKSRSTSRSHTDIGRTGGR
jgi:hypothetical protein